MDKKGLAQLKDEILKLLVDKEHGADINWLIVKLNKEWLNRDYLETVLDEIDDWDYNVLHVIRNERYYMQPTPLTQEFLDNGGFVNQYESDLEADIEAEMLRQQTRRIKDLEEKKLRNYRIPIIVSIISAVTAIGSLIYTINKSTDTVSKSELQELKNEVDSLRIEFKKENDSIRNRLYEAEMMIAVYEGEDVN